MPVFYECQRCTSCCRWPGDVRVSDDELNRISSHLQLAADDFVQRYTRLRRDRQGLSLIEKENGECIFLEGNLCAIQAVKPQQCRDFPNLWKYPDAEKYCRAIPREVGEAEYVRLVSAATGREADAVREIMKRESRSPRA